MLKFRVRWLRLAVVRSSDGPGEGGVGAPTSSLTTSIGSVSTSGAGTQTLQHSHSQAPAQTQSQSQKWSAPLTLHTIPLTMDQRPDRPDEKIRLSGCGAKIEPFTDASGALAVYPRVLAVDAVTVRGCGYGCGATSCVRRVCVCVVVLLCHVLVGRHG